MKKAIKIILAIVGIVVLLIVTLVATLPLWLGPVVKPTVNTAVPPLTKTEFNLGHLSLNPYTGRLEVGEVFLSNPANYSEKCALKLGMFVLDVVPSSLATDVIHIEEVSVQDLFVSVVYNNKVLNFDQIQCNVTNALNLAAKEEKQTAQSDEEAQLEEISKKKVIIDKLSISGLKVSFGLVTLPIPPLTLTNIGTASNGATWTELWQQIVAAVMKSSGAVGDAFKSFGGKTLDVGNKAIEEGTKGLNSAIDSAKKLDLKSAEETLKSTRDTIKGLFK